MLRKRSIEFNKKKTVKNVKLEKTYMKTVYLSIGFNLSTFLHPSYIYSYRSERNTKPMPEQVIRCQR